MELSSRKRTIPSSSFEYSMMRTIIVFSIIIVIIVLGVSMDKQNNNRFSTGTLLVVHSFQWNHYSYKCRTCSWFSKYSKRNNYNIIYNNIPTIGKLTSKTSTSQLSLSSHNFNNNKNNDLIEEIKNEIDITSLIEDYHLPKFTRLSMDKATAICPFHNDHNPSMNIDRNKGLYKCFACGAGGDIFNFVREYDYLSQKYSIDGNDNDTNGSNGQNGKMSFPAAVSYIATKYCSKEIQTKVQMTFHTSTNNNHKNKMTPAQIEKHKQEQLKKERIILANSVAADYYANLLITSPKAGSARSHLFQRGISPSVVRTFALGYAPDAYFSKSNYNIQNNNNNTNNNNNHTNDWGKGSLVERLQTMGFEPKEIVEAGLAVVTSAAKTRLTSIRSMKYQQHQLDEQLNPTITTTSSSNNNKNSDDDENGLLKLQYYDIMDRFRGRLMVPIFDSSGKHILGFGGRDLDEGKNKEVIKSNTQQDQVTHENKATDDMSTSSSSKQRYRSPKYINSPESLVFEKKNVLFGLHTAKGDGFSSRSCSSSSDKRKEKDDKEMTFAIPKKRTIVIVEGYFDAISLYGAGISEVTASMGAALTYQQLEQAAKLIGQGRIIICLDNDDAGIGAVERLCSGLHIWDFMKKYSGVEVAVGSLPSEFKDPAEFVQTRSGSLSMTTKEYFEKEVIDSATLWNDWYIDRLMNQYHESDPSGFASVCDDITTFLSKNENPAERTKQAYEAAHKLARHLSGKVGEDPSRSLRIQLESDLLGMASRKALEKEKIAKGIEDVTRLEQKGTKLQQMSNSTPHRNPNDTQSTSKRKSFPNNYELPKRPKNGQSIQRSLSMRNKRQDINNRQQKPLVDHFNGFTFSPSDAAWLGLSSTHSGNELIRCDMPDWKKKKHKFVYFNSNEYLGYGNDPDVFQSEDDATRFSAQRDGTLPTEDADLLQARAEFQLLKTMVQFSSARLAMKSALSKRVDDSPLLIEWSSSEREWLFHCLTESPGYEPLPEEIQHGGSIELLKNHLQTRSDVPDRSFKMNEVDKGSTTLSSLDGDNDCNDSDNDTWNDSTAVDDFVNRQKLLDGSTSTGQGSLDVFFQESLFDDITKVQLDKFAISHEERAELTVQQALATMLKASALKRLNKKKNDWRIASEALDQRKLKRSNPEEIVDEVKMHIYNDLDDKQLTNLCDQIGREMVDAFTVVRELSESLTKLNGRLLDYCGSGREGRISQAQQDALAQMMEEHIASLPDDRDSPGSDENYIFGSDEFRSDVDHRYGGISLSDSNFREEETHLLGIFE